MSCCKRSGGLSNRTPSQLSASLSTAASKVPATTKAAVVDALGRSIVSIPAGGFPADIGPMLVDLSASAQGFDEVIGAQDWRSLHVCGPGVIFSCYKAGPDHFVAVETTVSAAALRKMPETSQIDDAFLPILENVSMALHGTTTGTSIGPYTSKNNASAGDAGEKRDSQKHLTS